MGRAAVRDLKKAVLTGTCAQASVEETEAGRASALALLDRSMRCGHDRLAILRLAAAIRIGARVRPEQWTYCERVMARVADAALHERVMNALQDSVAR
jgi:hypothetical protein